MIVQATDEWKMQRLGHVTASCISDVMSKGKGGESITRHKYKMKLVAERITGTIQESFTNAAMEWGIQQEEVAAMAYEVVKDTFVEPTGFVHHPYIKWLGVSPDRLVGNIGLIEIKCPNTNTHLEYLLSQQIPTKYFNQMQAQMWCTDREWCDFVSFDPRLSKKNQLLIIRLQRDNSFIAEMEAEITHFLTEVENLIIQLGE